MGVDPSGEYTLTERIAVTGISTIIASLISGITVGVLTGDSILGMKTAWATAKFGLAIMMLMATANNGIGTGIINAIVNVTLLLPKLASFFGVFGASNNSKNAALSLGVEVWDGISSGMLVGASTAFLIGDKLSLTGKLKKFSDGIRKLFQVNSNAATTIGNVVKKLSAYLSINVSLNSGDQLSKILSGEQKSWNIRETVRIAFLTILVFGLCLYHSTELFSQHTRWEANINWSDSLEANVAILSNTLIYVWEPISSSFDNL